MADLQPIDIDQIELAAFAWVQRTQDGLSSEQKSEFNAWLSADPRHRAALSTYQQGWDRFDPLVEVVTATDPKIEAFPIPAPDSPRTWRRSLQAVLRYAAIAACLTVAFVLWPRNSTPRVAQAVTLLALCEQRTLDDGSVVELNRNARIEVNYTSTERRVTLLQGEASFAVAKNKDRPFIVSAGGVSVRAVGTAFNVRFDSTAVNVVVTEGKVRVDPPKDSSGPAPEPSYLEINQKTTVQLAAVSRPSVVTLAPAQLEQELLWQPKLLDFDDSTLSDIVSEFNRRNPVHLVIESEATAARRMTANFRSDNVEGFVRLLESNFGVRAERTSEQEILLKRK